ncbi:hypothetical protein [Rubrivivax rivuli]|uniref:DUF998 domain-containing protein n=1 Tax=Rubrivivax rivuli TaxID=1862385 RepID=A0A437RES8_9BURK|nr:hypothetical protein [Rubrivivax rivuli]RVU45268.1 hypothetical protein EOE66_14090 [Rubrivivax rivuli]
MAPSQAPSSAGLPLWPLALAAGLVPAVAALLAFALSVQLQLVPGCNPFIDGCTSISRAARHDLPNHLFRALMLPAATLQGLVWLLAAHWLAGELGARRALRTMAALGVVAAAALVLYATFLGTEGALYRLLRQYGTVVYFGFTCLCMLLLGQGVQALARQRPALLPHWLVRTHVALACTLVALGVVNAIVAALLSAEAKARTENVTEWWGALIFVLCFCALALMWARAGVRLRLQGPRA